jgi:hypothetical protein
MPVHSVKATLVPGATGACYDIIDYHNGTPLWSYVPGNGNYNLYFDNSGSASYFCSVYSQGYYQMIDANGSGMCLAVNSSTGKIYEDTASACAAGDPWTWWFPEPALATYNGNAVNIFRNHYNSQCMYDNTQRPAIYNGCNPYNEFEWMVWPSI